MHNDTLICLVAIGREKGEQLAYQMKSFSYVVRQFQQIVEAERALYGVKRGRRDQIQVASCA